MRVEPRDAVVGIPTGVFTQVVLVPLLYLPIFWLFGHRDLSQDAKDLTNKASGAGVALLSCSWSSAPRSWRSSSSVGS